MLALEELEPESSKVLVATMGVFVLFMRKTAAAYIYDVNSQGDANYSK